jgi:hypothetical protein
MRQFARAILIGMAVFFAVTSFTSVAYSGAGNPEIIPGSPPNGVVVDPTAHGTILEGSLFIMYYGIYANPDGHFHGSANMVLNLRQKKTFNTLFGEVDDLVVDDPSIIQSTLTNLMNSQISADFFNSKPITITVKAVENFGTYTDTSSPLVTTYLGSPVTYVLTDVEIAVKKTK